MEDRFKFRIPMFTDKDSFDGFQYIELGEQIECTLCGYDKEPQQCTGLKDKNGKLIYEGDIVKVPDNYEEFGQFAGEIREVIFACGGFRLKPKWDKNARGTWLEDDSLYEILGNIYENSDLLSEVEG